MQRLYYSTGQAARHLGVTAATVRTLCENRLIVADTTPGGQWRLPVVEVERLKRDGLPQIPRPLPRVRANSRFDDEPFEPPAYSEFMPEPSEDVAAAEDQVAIAQSTLARRRVEREIEENEDWFRERERQEAAAKAAIKEKEQAKQAEQQRAEWMQEWIRYAIRSIPYDAREEVEIEVHNAVQAALAAANPTQPDSVTRRLVDAALHKALAPWNRKQDVNRALNASMNALPWELRTRSECATLKQCAWDAAAAALCRVRPDASYSEMQTAAIQAVQPMIREHQHAKACEGIVDQAYVIGTIGREADAAKEAVRQALALLPLGASEKQLELAKEAALAPHKAAVAVRNEKARLAQEEENRRRTAELRVSMQLSHLSRYLEKEYEFEDGYWGRRREEDRLRPLIQKALVDQVIENPDMTSEEIQESIEDEVDTLLD